MTDHATFCLSDEGRRIAEAVARAGGRPVLVGGWVRDRVLGQPRGKDVDLEVFGLEPGPLKRVLARFGPVKTVGRAFGVLKLTTREAEYDVSIPRREEKRGTGHRGFLVDTDPSMTFNQAASRRDFTMNAMGYAPLDGKLLDPHHGREDLAARVLRHVGPAFGEDPLRVLRAMQFAGRFELEIAPETLAICRQQDLTELPRERIWEEVKKLLLLAPAPSRGLRYAGPLGVLPYIPELAAIAPAGGKTRSAKPGAGAWGATLATVDAAARLRVGNPREDLPLMLAALSLRMGSQPDDPAPPARFAAIAAAGRFMDRFTNERVVCDATLALLVDAHLPASLLEEDSPESDAAIRRAALRVGLRPLERLARAVYLSAPEHARQEEGADFAAGARWLAAAERLGVADGPPEPMLKGRDLQELGVPAGPAMGDVLKEAFDLQLEGTLATLDDALAWVKARVAEGLAARAEPAGGEAAGSGGRRKARNGGP